MIRQHFGRYLAPEALSGQPLHPADDIYSLGVLLYELLTGRPLPLSAPDGFATVIDQGIVATEGTAIPEEIRDLLKRSLVPREHRIADVGSWHKMLNKLMFDGQYSPTTFNLAFFMHNLFRQDIERESQEIEIEKTLPLPTVQQPAAPVTQPIPPLSAAEIREGTGAGMAAAGAVAGAGAAVAEGTGVHEGTGPGLRETGVREAKATGVQPVPAPAEEPKKSKVSLIAAAAAVLALILGGGGWWWFTQRGGGEQVASQSVQTAPPAAPAEPVPTRPTEEELNAKSREMIELQANSMEEELREEYDQQLEELQSQLDKARREAEARRRREIELQKA